MRRLPNRTSPLLGIFAALGAVLATASACQPGEPEGGNQPTHVILVSLDTLRADRLNSYGYRDRTTSPNIDALARDGILFEACITTSPWTTPAHVSLLTSLYPSTHGLTQGFFDLRDSLLHQQRFNRLPNDRTTLAEALQSSGFATAAFTGGVTLEPKIGFDQGFAHYSSAMAKLNDRNMGEMLGWLEEHAAERSFLFWHTFEVHTPFLDSRFLDEVVPAAKANRVRADLASLSSQISASDADRTIDADIKVEDLRALLKQHGIYRRDVCDALYCGGIASADERLGELVRKLRELGLYDRSLIIVTSDHGEEFDDHHDDAFYHAHGHSMYDELTRVPLIIKLPAQEHAGTRVSRVVSLVDVMPTILDVLSVRPETNEMQGTSLRPFWEGRSVPADPFAVSESLVVPSEKKSIRTDQYKYIVSIPEPEVRKHGRRYIPANPASPELYDLERDPTEQNNLLDSEAAADHAELAASLEAKLRAFVSAQTSRTESVPVDDALRARLEALGYLE